MVFITSRANEPNEEEKAMTLTMTVVSGIGIAVILSAFVVLQLVSSTESAISTVKQEELYSENVAQALGDPVSVGEDPYRFVQRPSSVRSVDDSPGIDPIIEMTYSQSVAYAYGEMNTLPSVSNSVNIPRRSDNWDMGYAREVAHVYGEWNTLGESGARRVSNSIGIDVSGDPTDLTPENRSEPNVRLGRTKRGRDAEKETHT
jgi:hypothetical protein